MKTFIVWLEEDKATRDITRQLLTNLNYSKDALKDEDDIKFNQIPKGNLEAAISSLNIDDTAKQSAMDFVRSHPMEGLKSLIRSINPLSIMQQNKDISQQAVIPQGQNPTPKPGTQPQQPTQ